ncbi:putative T6SS immunity periplasmic lipoprotein [Cronobacter sakazakii]
MGTPTKDLSPDMKTLSAIFLMSLVNLTGCVADQATFNRAGDMRIINGEVCIYTAQAGPGDVFTRYAVYSIDDPNPKRHAVLLPAYQTCLPNGAYQKGEAWVAEYVLMKPGGELQKYAVSFTSP